MSHMLCIGYGRYDHCEAIPHCAFFSFQIGGFHRSIARSQTRKALRPTKVFRLFYPTKEGCITIVSLNPDPLPLDTSREMVITCVQGAPVSLDLGFGITIGILLKHKKIMQKKVEFTLTNADCVALNRCNLDFRLNH